jgi:hypothetical protein
MAEGEAMIVVVPGVTAATVIFPAPDWKKSVR